MNPPGLDGIHHIKIPVTDLHRSLDWYSRVFGYQTTLVFPEADGVNRGAGGSVPGLERRCSRSGSTRRPRRAARTSTR